MHTILLDQLVAQIPIGKIEEILTGVLKHSSIEEFISFPANNVRWTSSKEIFIADVHNFSNYNWLYYYSQFRDMQPEILTIESSVLSDISGIQTMQYLQKICIGKICPVDDSLRLSHDECNTMIEQILTLPHIKAFCINAVLPGSAGDNDKYWKEALRTICHRFPYAKRYEYRGDNWISLHV